MGARPKVEKDLRKDCFTFSVKTGGAEGPRRHKVAGRFRGERLKKHQILMTQDCFSGKEGGIQAGIVTQTRWSEGECTL